MFPLKLGSRGAGFIAILGDLPIMCQKFLLAIRALFLRLLVHIRSRYPCSSDLIGLFPLKLSSRGAGFVTILCDCPVVRHCLLIVHATPRFGILLALRRRYHGLPLPFHDEAMLEILFFLGLATLMRILSVASKQRLLLQALFAFCVLGDIGSLNESEAQHALVQFFLKCGVCLRLSACFGVGAVVFEKFLLPKHGLLSRSLICVGGIDKGESHHALVQFLFKCGIGLSLACRFRARAVVRQKFLLSLESLHSRGLVGFGRIDPSVAEESCVFTVGLGCIGSGCAIRFGLHAIPRKHSLLPRLTVCGDLLVGFGRLNQSQAHASEGFPCLLGRLLHGLAVPLSVRFSSSEQFLFLELSSLLGILVRPRGSGDARLAEKGRVGFLGLGRIGLHRSGHLGVVLVVS